MQRKYHMQDQVKNKIDEVMRHYDRSLLDLWSGKLMMMGGCFLLGIYWRNLVNWFG